MKTLPLIVSVAFIASACSGGNGSIELPQPLEDTGITLVQAIDARRSIRSYSDGSVTLEELARVLHCAQGITSERGFRAAPSAGATFPFTLYVVAEDVEDLSPGIYAFHPEDNVLSLILEGSCIDDLAVACLGQRCVATAALAIVMVADYSITTGVYGDRGIMYVHMEAGHISQNIYLQATALGLGTVAVGAFHDDDVAEILELEDNLAPVYLMPLGRL